MGHADKVSQQNAAHQSRNPHKIVPDKVHSKNRQFAKLTTLFYRLASAKLSMGVTVPCLSINQTVSEYLYHNVQKYSRMRMFLSGTIRVNPVK